MPLRIEPSDEYMHSVEAAANFNESMYFNLYDPAQRIGGFVRLGNRANEGYAELTACLYLPDGRVAFTYQKPAISSNDAFDAAGMRFEIIEPFVQLSVTYSGRACVLERPLDLVEPRAALSSNPWTNCSIALDYTGCSPMYGGELVDADGAPIVGTPEAGFARGHYEQHVRVEGTIEVGEQRWIVRGAGLRDHSWGPRHWQAPWWYRWLTANFGTAGGFVISVIARRDGTRRCQGVWLQDRNYLPIEEISISTDWSDPESYPRCLRARFRAGGVERLVDGNVLSVVPLRNRRRTPEGEPLHTRISEGLTEWRYDGRVGFGMSEYLDQIIDGQPVGVAEEVLLGGNS